MHSSMRLMKMGTAMTDQQALPKPTEDGVGHINLYTKGNTRLGRLASNLADSALVHPQHGRFRTAEGFWFYLTTGKQDDSLRSLAGFEAKRYGSTLKGVWNAELEREFKEGLISKVMLNDELRTLLSESSLPFEHYYYYGVPEKAKVINLTKHRWQTQFWESMRRQLKLGLELTV